MISRDDWGLHFPDICLMVEEKPQKNLNQENLSDRGSNLGPLDILPLDHSSDRIFLEFSPGLYDVFQEYHYTAIY